MTLNSKLQSSLHRDISSSSRTRMLYNFLNVERIVLTYTTRSHILNIHKTTEPKRSGSAECVRRTADSMWFEIFQGRGVPSFSCFQCLYPCCCRRVFCFCCGSCCCCFRYPVGLYSSIVNEIEDLHRFSFYTVE
jgi:hypothetical protein